MHKKPQNIIKISSQVEGGDYLQLVFDAGTMTPDEMVAKFNNFLRGVGYNPRDRDVTWNHLG